MRRWVLTAALLLCGPAAVAQEVLDEVEWDAILKATAPQVEEQQARAAAAVEEKARGKRGRAKEQAEIDRAAASVEPSATSASSELAPAQANESEQSEKPGKRGKRGRKAAASKAEAEGASKAGASAAEGKEDGGKAGKTAAAKGGKAAQSQEKGAGRGAKSAAAEKPLPPVKRGPNDRGVPANYIALKRYWHAPWEEDGRSKMAGMAPPLIIHPVHPVGADPTPYVLLPESTDGGFNEAQIEVASQAWGSWPGGPRVSRRLLNLIYHAAMHFDVFHVHLISGVRHDRGGSRHTHGLAADIVLPGVTDEDLATYFRAQGFCGVGIYTRAGFVHIDTRDTSYFWLDWSLPGRRNRQQQILGDQAKAADEAAMARGQGQFVNPPKLQKALEARLRKRKAKASRAVAQQAIQEGS